MNLRDSLLYNNVNHSIENLDFSVNLFLKKILKLLIFALLLLILNFFFYC